MLSLATWTMAAAVGLTGAAKPIDAAALLDAPTRHVRTTSRTVQELLRTGHQRSSTFASLLKRLHLSDVYVYVELVDRLPGAIEGRLLIMPPSHGYRYVRIQLALRGSSLDMIAVLGHELRHAVEVADAASVLDEDSLAALYQRIGVPRGPNVFDTLEAQETGRRVLKELIA
jgi:hypothetical protein